uniref:Uncharacterized protein n=1 Tax=Trichogramma kaykai TaxID=54128 RepID=A0ABD2X0R2_9HYME
MLPKSRPLIIFFSIDRSVIIYDHSKQQRYTQFTEKPRAYTIFAVTARTLRSLRSWTRFSVSGATKNIIL